MANVSLWSGVGVAVQSALGASKAITAIATGATATCSSSTADFSNGDYVLVASSGMSEVDGRVFRVSAVSAGVSFVLEGENTTGYGAFTAGGAEEITFGLTLQTLSGLSASGGDFEQIDITTIHDIVKKQIPGAANAAVFTFDSIWDVADAGLIGLKAASDSKAQRAIRFTFANGQKLLFSGYIGATLLPTGTAQNKVTTSVVVTMFGKPTVYAT